MIDQEGEINDSFGSWRIELSEGCWPIKTIHSKLFDKDIPKEAYNHDIYVPVVIVPISRTSAFVLGSYREDNDLGLMIHDLRIVDNQMVSSVSFILRGNQYNLKQFKFEMLRVADRNGCVGVSFFFRKLYYNGFNTFMRPKTLKSKPNSSLRAGMSMVQSSIDKNKSVASREAK